MFVYTPGQTLDTPFGRYRVDEALSRGEFAYSYRATELNSGETVLLKSYSKPVPDKRYSPWYPDYFRAQEAIGKRLGKIPDQAIQLRGHFVHQRAYHQVVEWVRGRPLEGLLPELAKDKTIDRSLQLAKVMLYTLRRLHEQDIVHCDLKPANFFAEEDASIKLRYRLKVADFDRSIALKEKFPGHDSLAGTFGYLSPEHLRGGEIPTHASDVFTVGGVMLQEILTGSHPFEPIIASATVASEANEAIARALQGGRVPPLDLNSHPRLAALPPEIPEIVRRCLSWRPEQRPTAAEVHQVLLGRNLPRRLVLVVGPLRWRITRATEFNRESCTRFFGEKAEAVSRHQGRFDPSDDFTEWTFHPNAGATNPTLLDGKPLKAPIELRAGQTLQVGNPASGRIGFSTRVEFESFTPPTHSAPAS